MHNDVLVSHCMRCDSHYRSEGTLLIPMKVVIVRCKVVTLFFCLYVVVKLYSDRTPEQQGHKGHPRISSSSAIEEATVLEEYGVYGKIESLSVYE